MQRLDRILVIGGSGYIGSNVFNYLRKYNSNTYKATRVSDNLTERDIYVDLLNKEEIKEVLVKYKFDIIINCSGYIYYQSEKQEEKIKELVEGNVYTISNLMECISELDIKKPKVIHLSSMAVLGNAIDVPVNEKHPTNPQSMYGISKLTAEKIVGYLSEKYDIKTLILRLPGVFGGTRKSGAVYHFIMNAIYNKNISVNTMGLKNWSTIYINTVSDMILELVNKYTWEQQCEKLNISYGTDIDIIDTALLIKRILESKSEVIIEEPIDYEEFYMENKRLNNVIDVSYCFENDLRDYINFLKNESKS